MTLDLLPELRRSGVRSLKLEGRMKSPEYVAIVTSVYRKYINMLKTMDESCYYVENSDKERLMQAFNRGGFTRGYLEGNATVKNLCTLNIPKTGGYCWEGFGHEALVYKGTYG